MEDKHISLAHGNGGRYMRELIAEIFARHLSDPAQADALDVTLDAAPISLDAGEVFMTTDGFIVQPLEFPGGDIGSLAVNGTVNDLAVSGAAPKYLSLNAFIEEGLEIATLERIVASLAAAARLAGVKVVAGDTKVLPRGEGGGLYLATTGVGVRAKGVALGMDLIQAGDCILASGPIGDHGICVMLARQDFQISGNVLSDCGNVIDLAKTAMRFGGLRFMRDPTRAGLAGVSYEIAHQAGMTVRLRETDVPVRDSVKMVCEMLGYDPYYLACEGRCIAIVAAEEAGPLLAEWQKLPSGEGAAIIGTIEQGAARIVLETELSGERILDDLEEDPLPRIC
ncbi:MAG: hydrogenase expression/formation protein HypE [Xanthomonadales bacterium]|jgi:hydrogenase expression/formation protein HypE|nr:hydrogenase expression/formation protein HypE [Xanthomonadales bacterium]